MPLEGDRTTPQSPKRWYRETWGIVLLSVLFFPVGLWLAWTGPWQGRSKIRFTFVVAAVAAASTTVHLVSQALVSPATTTTTVALTTTTAASTSSTTTTTRPSTATNRPTTTITSSGPPSVVTAADKVRIRQILTNSDNHFARLFSLGLQAAGTTQYANANAGLAAMSDPNSEASRFRAYYLKFDPVGDHSYSTAYAEADKFYTLADVPNSLSTWYDDMNSLDVALLDWAQMAPDWQVRVATTAQFHAAGMKVLEAINQSLADINRVIAGKKSR